MQLYVQAWLLDKDGNRVKQNMAITIHHPEAMTDEKAEQLLESLKDELLQKWGNDYTLESIDFVPEQNLDMKIVEGVHPKACPLSTVFPRSQRFISK